MLASIYNKVPRIIVNGCRINQLRQAVSSLHRSNSSNASNDEFAGLTLANPKVQHFLRNLGEEYADLTRSEQRSRAGHRRLATLTPLLKILETRNETLENLKQLQTEMKNEQDKELLGLIEEEKKVHTFE